VLYHFGVPGFSGGGSGVDIFFVISGFLMAGIVCGGLDSKDFRLWDFYFARARRILPALIVLVLIVLGLGWFLLMPSEYQMLGRHARESLLFTSNLRYLSESGYFDVASHGKWLLHTWSLSVEWQFYLIYPLVLCAIVKWLPGRKSILCAHLLFLLMSLILCLFLTFNEPEKAFYWLPSRAWELLLGSCVYLLGKENRCGEVASRYLELIGVVLILMSVLLIESSLPWPGGLAIFPVAGAALLLLAQREKSFWTGNPVAQWLGTRSYSVYLWHWPIVVVLVHFELHSDPLWICIGVFCSLLIGHLSYRWVESTSSRWLTHCSKMRAVISLVSCLVVVAVAAQLVRRTGIPERLPVAVRAIDDERHNRNPRQDECLDDEASCVYGGNDVQALVFGDSHADAVVSAVVAAAPTTRVGIYFRGVSGCLFVSGARRIDGKSKGCERMREKIWQQLPELYPGKPIILVNRTTAYMRGHTVAESTEGSERAEGKPIVYFSKKYHEPSSDFLDEFRDRYVSSVCALAKNHPVYLLRPIPEMPANVPKIMGRESLMGHSVEVKLSRVEYEKRHAFTWSMQDEAVSRCGVKILNPLPYLCDEVFCYGGEGGVPLYVDDDHLSERGNRKLIPLFAQVFTGLESSD